MNAKKSNGENAEALAADYLCQQGLKIRQRNYHCRSGELDLIAEHKSGDEIELVIVEVRYRGAGAAVDAASSVDVHKQRRIISATGHFLSHNPSLAEQPLRFDVVAISGSLTQPEILWIRDAFQ